MSNETRRVQLNYPSDRVQEPVLYELINRFDLVPSIRRANFDTTGGFIAVELRGEKDSLEDGLAWLDEAGIVVTEIGLDGAREWEAA
jgi:hypothetical protein